MSDGNPLIDLGNIGDLSKPATALIEKISDAVGGFLKPWQTVRVANAEAKAVEIQAKARVKVTDIERRALQRFLKEEAKKQVNIESITQKALPLLEDKSTPEKVSDDWMTNFFEKARIVSDTDMQQLWARVLAGEANSPGRFDKRTVNLIGDLERRDAELFTSICRFCWTTTILLPMIFDTEEAIYKNTGLTFFNLTHLESLGLIRFDHISGFRSMRNPKRLTIHYFGRSVELTFPQETDNDLSVGKVLLTRSGQQLGSVCQAVPVDGFFDFVYDKWAAESLVPKREVTATTEKSS